MSFAKNEFVSTIGLSRLKPEVIASVELYYTDFPKGKDFEKLNLSRFARLFAEAPALFSASHITWKIVAQNEASEKKAAEDLFHGFVLRKKVVEKKEEDKPKISIRELAKKDPIVRDSLKFWEILNKNIVPTGDSTVLKILTRFPDWKNLLIVNDWTGSMYEYGTEVLLWYKLNEARQKDVKSVVFFNDGDTLSDYKKIIGKTGGVYIAADSLSLEKMVGKMVECMRGGHGGDLPENDLEAIITGLGNCTDCKEVILIADGRSAVRDMALLSEIKRPVHVILCGVSRQILLDYVKIAYETNGTVHTIEEDIVSFAKTQGEVRLVKFAGSLLVFGNGIIEIFDANKHYNMLSAEQQKEYKKSIHEEKKRRKFKK
jgi:hypothetical protein